jgi:hypothetical protein
VGDKFPGTGLTSATSTTLNLSILDNTNDVCEVGLLGFDVELNGVIVGTFEILGGLGLGLLKVVYFFTHDPVAGGGPAGDGFRVRVILRDGVCEGGGKFQVLPSEMMQLN